jgi:hypothetical protein
MFAAPGRCEFGYLLLLLSTLPNILQPVVQFTTRAGPWCPKTAVKEEATRNNIAAGIIYWHNVIPTGSDRNNLLSLSIQYLLWECDILLSGNSLNTANRLAVQYRARFLYTLILLLIRGHVIGVKTWEFVSLRNKEQKPNSLVFSTQAKCIDEMTALSGEVSANFCW